MKFLKNLGGGMAPIAKCSSAPDYTHTKIEMCLLFSTTFSSKIEPKDRIKFFYLNLIMNWVTIHASYFFFC